MAGGAEVGTGAEEPMTVPLIDEARLEAMTDVEAAGVSILEGIMKVPSGSWPGAYSPSHVGQTPSGMGASLALS